MQIFQSFHGLQLHQCSALDLPGGLQHPPDPPSCSILYLRHNSAQFGTLDHIQSLHKFLYIYPIFLLLISYNTLYFYLKLPINYAIFCSEYACRPAYIVMSILVTLLYHWKIQYRVHGLGYVQTVLDSETDRCTNCTA